MQDVLNQIRNIDLERTVLASVLLNSKHWIDIVEENITSDYFYDPRHQKIFDIMDLCSRNNENIDTVVVCNYIAKHSLTDKISITYVNKLLNSVATTAGFKSYLVELKSYREKRQIKGIMNFIQDNLDKDNLKEELINKVLTLNNMTEAKDSGEISSGIQKFKDDLEFRLDKDNPNKISGLISGIKALDKTLDGLNKGNLITIVARSGIGKTTFATSIMLNMLRNKYKIGMFSMEMPQEQIIKKMAFNYCSVDSEEYKNGELSDDSVSKIIRFTEWLEENNNLLIFTESNFNRIIAKIKMQLLKRKMDVIIIDYLNKITGVKEGNRDTELNTITSTLKDIALQNNICIIQLTQANRQVDKQTDKRITLADIKESSSIEQNSDQIISLYRDKKLDNPAYRDELSRFNKLDYAALNADVNPDCIELEILKNRHGDCKTIACRWDGKLSRVKNW